MFRFEELEIWRLAIEYGNFIYDVSEKFPVTEKYNLTDQIKRAALSISSNIAEGSATSTVKNFCSFLDISLGSVFETVNILCFAQKRGYILEQDRLKYYQTAELLVKKIRAFKRSLKEDKQ